MKNSARRETVRALLGDLGWLPALQTCQDDCTRHVQELQTHQRRSQQDLSEINKPCQIFIHSDNIISQSYSGDLKSGLSKRGWVANGLDFKGDLKSGSPTT